ncbi:Protein goliath [Diplonema papillatum]|nr:Protein goliath [Diplonema papillatum]
MANTPAARPPETTDKAEAGGREEEKDAEEKDTSSGTNPLDLALPTAPLPLEILREDLRNVLDAFPDFRAFFWKHGDAARAVLAGDWQARYETEEWDYSGASKRLREFVTELRAGGYFNVRDPAAHAGKFACAEPAPSAFAVGQDVRMRDEGEPWQDGVVKSVQPLRVRPSGSSAAGKNWRDAPWHEVQALPFSVGQAVRVRDRKTQWKPGKVKALNPLRVELSGSSGSHCFDFVERLPEVKPVGRYEEHPDLSDPCCGICLAAYTPDDELASPSDACAHVFHQACLRSWFNEHPACPICRVDGSPPPPLPPTAATGGAKRVEIPGGGTPQGDAALAAPPGGVYLAVGAAVSLKSDDRGYEVVGFTPEGGVLVEGRLADGRRDGRRVAVAADDVIGRNHPPRLGTTLRIHGLSERKELNDTTGLCIGFVKSRVVLLLLNSTDDRKALRLENVRYE